MLAPGGGDRSWQRSRWFNWGKGPAQREEWMAVFIDHERVGELLSWSDAVAFLKESLLHEAAGETFVTGKFASNARGVSMRILFAADFAAGYGATKAYHSVPGAGARYLISLIDLASGELLAIVDGRRITDMRTAAASGAVAGKLQFDRPPDVAILGSGRQARAQLRCLNEVLSMATVSVYSPTAENRARFAKEMSAELGLDIVAADSAEEAVRGKPVVLAATKSRSSEPVVLGDWLADCRLLMAVGNTRAQFKEIDTHSVGLAKRIVVDSEHALAEAGELVEAVDEGVLSREKVQVLSSLMQPGADLPETGLVLFKSVGTALQDLSLASRCYEKMRGAPGALAFPDLASSG